MKKTLLTSAILFAFNLCGQLQTKDIKAGGFELQSSTVNPKLNELYCINGQAPEFNGGKDSLVAFAKRNLYYPKNAITDSIEGKVIVEFTVDTFGHVVDPKIFKGVRTDVDEVCLSMLRLMPSWAPGRLDNKAIAVKFRWPVKFTLTKSRTK